MKTRLALIRTSVFVAIAIAVSGMALFEANSSRERQAAAAPKNASRSDTASVRFTSKGEMIRPDGYRKWIFVGAPITPNDMNNGKAAFPEFHSVYINPQAYQHYQQTGEFPHGTVFVKELVSVGAKEASSGNGYFMGEFTGLEVLMKDKQRFKNEPGNWGFFSFGHTYPLKRSATLQATTNCNDCHGAAADDDFVFTQYYPVLRAAAKRAK